MSMSSITGGTVNWHSFILGVIALLLFSYLLKLRKG